MGRCAENVDAIEMKKMIMEERGMSGKYKVMEKVLCKTVLYKKAKRLTKSKRESR